MPVRMLHNMARISNLNDSRDIQLLILFDIKGHNLYKKDGCRITRSTAQYIFETDIVHSGVYAKSPYYKGASTWNSLPRNLQNMTDKCKFKNVLKKHLNVY